MRLFFTVRQVPECAHLTDDQIRAVERKILWSRFRTSSWILAFAALGLGHVGSLIGWHLSGGADGWRFFGGVVCSVAAVPFYVPTVVGRARPAIRDYVVSQRW